MSRSGMSRQRFLERLAGVLPGGGGYEDRDVRRRTDARFREHAAASLDGLRAKIDQLKTAAEEEGEEDLIFDLDRIDERMGRTSSALRAAEATGAAFLDLEVIDTNHLERVYAYDLALLEDVELLTRDFMAVKYDTIGTLTLRELEGTLAAIELKVSNRGRCCEIQGAAHEGWPHPRRIDLR
ncbi:MAG: hypothetical protein ACE5HU_09955 [Acidobacteriota bacterium]